MNKKFLFTLWGCLFILCAGLGFIPDPQGMLANVLSACAFFSFVPPALLLYGAVRSGEIPVLTLIRNLSALSLGLTLGVLILNFGFALGSDFLGTVLYYILVIVSSPMVCSGHWAMSLFLWACLLMVSLRELRKTAPSRKKRHE